MHDTLTTLVHLFSIKIYAHIDSESVVNGHGKSVCSLSGMDKSCLNGLRLHAQSI